MRLRTYFIIELYVKIKHLTYVNSYPHSVTINQQI